MRAALVVAALALGCGGGGAARRAAPVAAEGAALDAGVDAAAGVSAARVGVLGASVSAGFAAPRVAEVFAGAGAGAVIDAADVGMFLDPRARGAAQVAQVTAGEPTLVVALDFLFWFVYQIDAPAGRLASLDVGLGLLDGVTAPLAVGELPDMRTAHPRLIDPRAVPSPDELAAVNARVRAWAAARPRTVVIPLAAWVAPLAAGGEVELTPGERVAASTLVSFDGLHANELGLWYLLVRLDDLLTAELGVPAGALTFARPTARTLAP